MKDALFKLEVLIVGALVLWGSAEMVMGLLR